MARSKKDETGEISVDLEFAEGQVDIGILGLTPLIYNRMAMKARGELLFPSNESSTQKKKSGRLKHDPLQEYRDSVYRRRDNEAGSTRLLLPSPAIKGAIATAALDVPGLAKTKINRLVWVAGYSIDIYGVPEFLMSVVRSSDMQHTPDIRTRAIIPNWGCIATVSYVMPFIKANVLTTLASFSGMTVGVGDFRQEKGKGNYGRFEIVAPDDIRLKTLMKLGGMAAQDAALQTDDPVCHDQDTEDLWYWFREEQRRRETSRSIAVKTSNRRTKGAGAEARA